jgi:hypothetical protein
MLPFVFPSLTFNKHIYTHMPCHGFFLVENKEFGSLLIIDSTVPLACGEGNQEKW